MRERKHKHVYTNARAHIRTHTHVPQSTHILTNKQTYVQDLHFSLPIKPTNICAGPPLQFADPHRPGDVLDARRAPAPMVSHRGTGGQPGAYLDEAFVALIGYVW